MIRVAAKLLTLLLCATASAAQETGDMALWGARDRFLAGEHAAGLAVIAPLAEDGNPRAQTLMGFAHNYGLGVAQEGAAARDWLERAAAQGYPPAHFNLGVLYEQGAPGIGVDDALARDHYLASAALEFPPGLTTSGVYLVEGLGGPPDIPLGLRLLRRAAEQGDARGSWYLATLHLDGRHVPPDAILARRLMSVAAYQDHLPAVRDLARLREQGIGGPVDLIGAHDLHLAATRLGAVGELMNAVRLIDAHPDVFPDRVPALAHCLRLRPTDPDDAEICRRIGKDMTPADRARAEAMATAP